MPYRTTHAADQDIAEIYVDGCRKFGKAQAERYFAELVEVLDLIGRNPGMARERPEFNPPIRLHPHRLHLIAYLTDAEGVLVVRVLHGREEWARHL